MSLPKTKLTTVELPTPSIRELPTILESQSLLRRILNEGLYYVYQRKYGLDREPKFTRFQKWYHKNIWLRFARFSKRKIGVPTGDGVDKNGDTFYLDSTGFVIEEWQAEQAIAQYESGGYHKLPIMKLLPSHTMLPLGEHVVQTNGRRHKDKQNGQRPPQERIALDRLIEDVARGKRIIAAHE